MGRLTYYMMKGSENDGYYLCPGVSQEEAIARLAAYEKTNLTPEEVQELAETTKVDRVKFVIDRTYLHMSAFIYNATQNQVIDKDAIINTLIGWCREYESVTGKNLDIVDHRKRKSEQALKEGL